MKPEAPKTIYKITRKEVTLGVVFLALFILIGLDQSRHAIPTPEMLAWHDTYGWVIAVVAFASLFGTCLYTIGPTPMCILGAAVISGAFAVLSLTSFPVNAAVYLSAFGERQNASVQATLIDKKSLKGCSRGGVFEIYDRELQVCNFTSRKHWETLEPGDVLTFAGEQSRIGLYYTDVTSE